MARVFQEIYGSDADGNRGMNMMFVDDISPEEIQQYLIETYGDDREEWPTKFEFPVYDGRLDEVFYVDIITKDYV